MTEALLPDCKPLFHRMAVCSGTAFTPPSPILHDPKPTATCHQHHVVSNSQTLWHPCPVHGCGGTTASHQSMALPAASHVDDFESSFRNASSMACSPSLENNINAPHVEDVDYESADHDIFREGDRGSIGYRSLVNRDESRRSDGKPRSSYSYSNDEEELKKACEQLCAQMQWKSEKQYQEAARSSFWQIGRCQAALHAWHDESNRRRDYRGATDDLQGKEDHGRYRYRGHCSYGAAYDPRDQLMSFGQSHSSFSDATFARSFRECCKERPVSVPIHERAFPTSAGRRRSLVPEEHLQRYSESARPHVLKGVNGEHKGVVPLHPSSSLRSERFRSKSVDEERPWLCTGLKRWKGETEDAATSAAAAAKKTLNVVPVVMLHRDKTMGVWNRKANQKEWDHGRRGCCSQHWVSVLENTDDKVFHADGRKALSARASLSPVPKGKFAAMTTQKLKVQGERCRPFVARSLDLSSSPLTSLKAMTNEMSRPQSASLPKRSNTVSTPRSASTTRKSGQNPSIPISPARKLNNPELNSSAWLLAKLEALRNETFTEPRALQIAKEHGIVLDKEDEAALKEFLQSDQSARLDGALDAAELEGNKSREKYFNLSNIKLAESDVPSRKIKKKLSPKPQAVRIREC